MKQKERCPWAYGSSPLYIPYHDEEWGVPVRDDRLQFEFLTLESAQAGLSWSTVLNKREGYRRAFAGFDPEKVARFGEKKIAELLKDPGIVRNRLKVRAAVNNARRFLEVRAEFGTFSAYIWGFVGGRPKVNRWARLSQLPASSKESDALSADLKRRGFKFVGSTIMYAHMQATGLVNDHLVSCFRRLECGRRKAGQGVRGKYE
ncbi:MAG: DNA-3-methyladenine glycosylase I [Elusimicrobia bacterium HGW-Elusimicrobia-3]|nr:MAG: DNA-3-methyladenine glycosylase I [Elusimicrobia bacterium HGW-Elusimicrobia-3]